MKIAICSSLDFTAELKEIADKLSDMGMEVRIPFTSEMILRGDLTVEGIKAEKESGKFSSRAIRVDAIRRYWKVIKECDAILVTNYDKKGMSNYIGGNTFLEMGFAHVLGKKIFLLGDIPEMSYSDEIRAMQPKVIGGDLALIE